MKWNEYLKNVFEETKQYFEDCCWISDFLDSDYNYGWDEFVEHMDEAEMAVTGNDNSSYYCNRLEAENAVRDLFFDEEFYTALKDNEMYDSFNNYVAKDDPESADVIARIVAFYENYPAVEEWLKNHGWKCDD